MIIVKCIKTSNGLILNQCYEVNDHRFERNNPNSYIDIYDKDGKTVGLQYAELDNMAKQLGSALHAPYMTLSFMALLVIPSLKLSDKGLFNGQKFTFTSLEVN